MNRVFIPNDPLSQHDYLFEKSMETHLWQTGKVKGFDTDGHYLLFCQSIAGTVEADPTTWIPAQAGADNQSSVKYRIGQTVNVKFPSGAFDFGVIIGLNRDYVETFTTQATKDAIHENSATQTIVFDRLLNTYTITNGATVVTIKPAAVEIVTTNMALTGIFKINGMDILAAIQALQSAYNSHTHVVSAAPGTSDGPVPTVTP